MNSFVKRLYVLWLVLIAAIAFVKGLTNLGYEMGPAASVREQYRIFLIQKAELRKDMRDSSLEQPRL